MTRKQEDFNDSLNSIASSVYEWLEKRRQEANRPSDIRLGIWGTARSGKTTYLTMLYQELMSSKYWRVGGTPEAKDFAKGKYSLMKKTKTFCQGTEPEDTTPIYEYWLTETGKNNDFMGKIFKNPLREEGKSITLEFIDAPGIYYEKPIESSGRVKGTDIIDYLDSCDGIIFLLDPERQPDLEPISDLLSDLVSEFQTRYNKKMANKVTAPLPHYMAFCVTKVDEGERLEKADAPELLAQEILGETFFTQLLENFCNSKRMKFFAISSIGCYEEGGKKIGGVYNPDKKEEPSQNEDLSPKPEVWKNERSKEKNPQTHDSFGFTKTSPDEPESGSPNRKTIRMDKNPKPLNVIEPVEWLIKGIEKEPPFKKS